MKLKELEQIWGTPVKFLEDYSRKYKFWYLIVSIINVVLIFFLTYLMYIFKVSFETYGFIILSVSILTFFLFFLFLSQDVWEAYKFYLNYGNCDVQIKKYKVSADNLYSVLYCIVYKRLKSNRDFDYYKECFLSACNENVSASKQIMKYLSRYENENGNLTCYIIRRGRHSYFIDFIVDSEIVEYIEEED